MFFIEDITFLKTKSVKQLDGKIKLLNTNIYYINYKCHIKYIH